MVAEDDDWTAVTSVLEDDGRLVGWLMGSVDAEMGRVWWFGPFLDAPDEAWPALADMVIRRRPHPAARVPVRQEELAVDSRLHHAGPLGDPRAGSSPRPGQPLLVLEDDLDPPSVPVRPVRPRTRRPSPLSTSGCSPAPTSRARHSCPARMPRACAW